MPAVSAPISMRAHVCLFGTLRRRGRQKRFHPPTDPSNAQGSGVINKMKHQAQPVGTGIKDSQRDLGGKHAEATDLQRWKLR